jgi:hypothetical protein
MHDAGLGKSIDVEYPDQRGNDNDASADSEQATNGAGDGAYQRICKKSLHVSRSARLK